MSVEWVWSGAGSDTSVWVRGKVTGSSTRLAVSEAADLSDPVFYGPVSPTAEGVASIEATGLAADTRYYYALEDDSTLDTDFSGTFRTHPEVGSQASFTVGAAGDAGLTGAGDDSHITSAVSDNPVFDTMRQRALDEDWLQFLHLGDLHYRNISTNDHSLYREAFHDNLTYNDTLGADAKQGTFFRNVPLAYVWDDHDYGPNNSDSTHAGRQAAAEVYREIVPHYRLPAGSGNAPIYQSWQVGRVLFIASDVRWARDPNADYDDDPTAPKTMLGTEQKAWMEQVLRNSPAQALVWMLPSLWMSDQGNTRNAGIGFSGADYSSDSYHRFRREREELVELFGAHGWLDRMVCLQADKHALSISSGPNNPWGHFPVFMFASMDSGHSANPEGQYDIGQSPGRQRYGTLQVEDSGHTIAITGTGYIGDSVWRSYTAYAHVESHTLALDYDAGHVSPPLEPTDDDQQLVNDFTASRQDGGEFRYELADGPASVDPPPDGVGRYTGSETYNVPADADLPPQAGWQVHKGTVDQARYPSVTVNLHDPRMKALRPDAARTDVGDRVTIDNPPDFLPPGRIDLIAEGYGETINTHEWQITYNASPASTTDQVGTVAPELILNSNHDFETTIYGWNQIGCTVTRTNEHAYRGQYSGRMEPDGTTGTTRILTRTEDSPRVYAGIQYDFSVWVRSANGYDVDMSVAWLDDTETNIGFPFLRLPTTMPAGVWTRMTGSAVAPEGAHRLRWNINQRDTPASTDVLWIDEAVISDGAELDPNQSNRVDTTGSELAVGVDASDTELVVHTAQDAHGGTRWINSDGPTRTHQRHFPLDLGLGGEIVRATGCEPAAWDEFRRPDETGTWGTSDSGTAWLDTADADTVIGSSSSDQYGSLQLTANTATIRLQRLDLDFDVGDCEVLWTVRTNQIAAGSAQLPSLLLRYQGGSDYYRCRVHLNTDQTVSLTVSRDITQIGGTVDLPLVSYDASAALGDRIWVRTRLIGHRVLARAWRIEDPDTSLELAHQEPAHWQIDREIEDDPIEAGAIGFTASTFGGYTGTDPELRYQVMEVVTPQRMTVERSINTVAKAHSAGAAIGLQAPAVVGL